MNINELTIGQARDIAALVAGSVGISEHPYKIGLSYHIRTVTHHFTGRLTWVGPQELVIEDAAWIASDGRFFEAIRTGEHDEIEPFPDGPVIIGRGSIVNAVMITYPLPRTTI